VIADRGSNSLTPSAIADCAELDPVTGPEGEMTKGRWVGHGRKVIGAQSPTRAAAQEPASRQGSKALKEFVLSPPAACPPRELSGPEAPRGHDWPVGGDPGVIRFVHPLRRGV
jgi:hypothetical protein